VKGTRVARWAGAVAGAGIASFGAYTALIWARYGRAHPGRHPVDELLDGFLPNPEVDEYHCIRVHAPAAITYATAKNTDLMAAPAIKGIFWLRALPGIVRGRPFRPDGPRSILAETLAQGWGVLAEVPDREIVVGAYTQPWHEQVTFRSLPPDEFASFDEPGYTKIVWTLGVQPVGPHESVFITRTRVATTDQMSRRKFRRYWAPMSAGILLIRYVTLPMVRREAERTARRAQA
jgi:hypothetical protein